MRVLVRFVRFGFGSNPISSGEQTGGSGDNKQRGPELFRAPSGARQQLFTKQADITLLYNNVQKISKLLEGGLLPQIPLGILQPERHPGYLWGGLADPSPKPHPCSQPFGLRASALRASQLRTPNLLSNQGPSELCCTVR